MSPRSVKCWGKNTALNGLNPSFQSNAPELGLICPSRPMALIITQPRPRPMRIIPMKAIGSDTASRKNQNQTLTKSTGWLDAPNMAAVPRTLATNPTETIMARIRAGDVLTMSNEPESVQFMSGCFGSIAVIVTQINRPAGMRSEPAVRLPTWSMAGPGQKRSPSSLRTRVRHYLFMTLQHCLQFFAFTCPCEYGINDILNLSANSAKSAALHLSPTLGAGRVNLQRVNPVRLLTTVAIN